MARENGWSEHCGQIRLSSCGWSLENAVRSQSGNWGALDLVLKEGARSRESWGSRSTGSLPAPWAHPQIRPRLSQQSAPEGFAAVNLWPHDLHDLCRIISKLTETC